MGDLVRMPSKYKMIDDKLYDIELGMFLTNNLWLLDSLRNKRIRFNPRPFKKPTRTSIKEVGEKKDNLVDFHLEIVKKIDEIIEKNQRETVTPDSIGISSKTESGSILKEIVEIREPWARRLEKYQFTPLLEVEEKKGLIGGFEDELFEVEIPTKGANLGLKYFRDVETNNTPSLMEEDSIHFNEEDETMPHKTVMALGRIKIRRNNVKKTGKNRDTPVKKDKKHVTKDNGNGLSTVKKELEKTKMELEKKKKELEEMKRKARLKEEELKKKKEERKKREKLRKLELKKLAREEKIRAKEAKKKAREKEKMRRKLEREKKLETRQKAKKKEKVEKETSEKKEKLVGLFSKKRKDKTVETASTVKNEIVESKKGEDFNWDEEVREALIIIDRLLEKLPDETIDEFVQSKDFEVYERVVSKYKNLGK